MKRGPSSSSPSCSACFSSRRPASTLRRLADRPPCRRLTVKACRSACSPPPGAREAHARSRTPLHRSVSDLLPDVETGRLSPRRSGGLLDVELVPTRLAHLSRQGSILERHVARPLRRLAPKKESASPQLDYSRSAVARTVARVGRGRWTRPARRHADSRGRDPVSQPCQAASPCSVKRVLRATCARLLSRTGPTASACRCAGSRPTSPRPTCRPSSPSYILSTRSTF